MLFFPGRDILNIHKTDCLSHFGVPFPKPCHLKWESDHTFQGQKKKPLLLHKETTMVASSLRCFTFIYLVKLSYFTNLDVPEIRRFPLLFATIWGEVVWGRDEIWPDLWVFFRSRNDELRKRSRLKFPQVPHQQIYSPPPPELKFWRRIDTQHEFHIFEAGNAYILTTHPSFLSIHSLNFGGGCIGHQSSSNNNHHFPRK